MQTIISKFYDWAEKCPDRLAVVLEEETVTYGALKRTVNGFAKYLQSRGVRKGDRVVIRAEHETAFPATVLACHVLGAVFVPVDKTAPDEKVYETVEEVKACLLITGDDERFRDRLPVVAFGDVRTLAEQYAEGEPLLPAAGEDDLADIMFTTGTTGKSKGVMLSHRNLTATVVARAKRLSILPDNVSLTAVPINHVAPMRELYLNLWNGSTVCFLDGIMKLNAFFTLMHDYNVTSLYMPPAHVHMVLDMAGDELSKYRDQIDYVYIGSAPFDELGKQQLIDTLPHSKLFFSYGSSENGSVSLLEFSRDRGRPSCCGQALQGVDVQIMDDAFRPMKTGENGLITMSSEMNMMGYWQRPDLDEQVFRDGRFMSNDIGYLDADGFLYVIGRRDDVINIGGLKVSPTEIEDAVRWYPAIEDCICVAVPDALVGQKPKLYVVIKAGQPFEPVAIAAFLGTKLEAFKVPDLIEQTDAVRRTPNGKPDRKAYRV